MRKSPLLTMINVLLLFFCASGKMGKKERKRAKKEGGIRNSESGRIRNDDDGTGGKTR